MVFIKEECVCLYWGGGGIRNVVGYICPLKYKVAENLNTEGKYKIISKLYLFKIPSLVILNF